MKKKYLIGIIIVIIGIGLYVFFHKSQINKSIVKTSINASIENSLNIVKPSFTSQEQNIYYKLSQNVGDIGMPSAAMTTNLDQGKLINGSIYYKTYSYDTRAAYENDNSTPNDGNYSHLVSSKIINLTGGSILNNEFGVINSSNLSGAQIENQVAKIASLYVEGYTANNPNLQSSTNSDYESNLNEVPIISVNLSNTKNINNEILYNAIIKLNNKQIPIYVGLDGYIYISSESYFNQIFFPNKIN
ncbi:MAG: hypothetical protein ACRDCW_15965 [Sarcina sp.]